MTGARARYRDVLRARDLRLLVLAFSAASLGGWAYNVVLVVHLYDRTGSTAVIAATSACSWVPRLAVTAYAGVVADRYERTRVMQLSAAACALLVLALSAGVALAVPVVTVLALHAALSTCAAFYEPAAQALVPDVVPEKDLVAANSVFGVVDNLAVIGGPALGAMFLLLDRAAAGILFNAFTFVTALMAVRALRVRSRGTAAAEQSGTLRQLGAGFGALRREPAAVVLVLFAAMSTAVYGALSLMQIPLSQRFGTGSEGYAYLLAATAVGGVVGAALTNRLAAVERLAPVLVGGMLAMALPLAACVLVSSPVPGAGLQVVSGAGMVVVDVLALTALQRALPGGVLSRVLGLLDSLGLAGALLASITASALVRTVSLEAALLLFGLGFALLSLLGLRPLTRVDRHTASALASLRPRLELLRRVELLEGATPRTLEQLAAGLERQELPAGQVVVRQGEQADAMFLVAEGALSVVVAGAPPLPDLQTGDLFGEISLLHPGGRTATVRTTTPAVLWRLSAEDFAAALETSSPSSGVLQLSAARLARSHPRVVRRG